MQRSLGQLEQFDNRTKKQGEERIVAIVVGKPTWTKDLRLYRRDISSVARRVEQPIADHPNWRDSAFRICPLQEVNSGRCGVRGSFTAQSLGRNLLSAFSQGSRTHASPLGERAKFEALTLAQSVAAFWNVSTVTGCFIDTGDFLLLVFYFSWPKTATITGRHMDRYKVCMHCMDASSATPITGCLPAMWAPHAELQQRLGKSIGGLGKGRLERIQLFSLSP